MSPKSRAEQEVPEPTVDLAAYRRFAEAVASEATRCHDAAAFTQALKHDKEITRLRSAARAEFQAIYDQIRPHFAMPPIPVYLPVRKKVLTRGQAHAQGCSATELRLYPVQGVIGQDYVDWSPRDIHCMTTALVFCAFVHEVAHILEVTRHGGFSEHGEAFKRAERDVAAHLRESGYGSLLALPLSQGPTLPPSPESRIPDHSTSRWVTPGDGVREIAWAVLSLAAFVFAMHLVCQACGPQSPTSDCGGSGAALARTLLAVGPLPEVELPSSIPVTGSTSDRGRRSSQCSSPR